MQIYPLCHVMCMAKRSTVGLRCIWLKIFASGQCLTRWFGFKTRWLGRKALKSFQQTCQTSALARVPSHGRHSPQFPCTAWQLSSCQISSTAPACLGGRICRAVEALPTRSPSHAPRSSGRCTRAEPLRPPTGSLEHVQRPPHRAVESAPDRPQAPQTKHGAPGHLQGHMHADARAPGRRGAGVGWCGVVRRRPGPGSCPPPAPASCGTRTRRPPATGGPSRTRRGSGCSPGPTR